MDLKRYEVALTGSGGFEPHWGEEDPAPPVPDVNEYLRQLRDRLRAPAADPGPEPPRPAPVYRRATPADERNPHRAEALAQLPFTARAVLMLAPDLDVTTREIVYTALWAPRVARDMAERGGEAAYLSRETLTAATGLDGQKLMVPGGIPETGAVGLVRMVVRGVPGAIPVGPPSGGEQFYRGQATSWTLTAPLEDFGRAPARTAEPRKIQIEGRDRASTADLSGMQVYLNPLHPWWSRSAAGRSGLRLIASLIARYGLDDVVIGGSDAGRLLDSAPFTGQYTLAKLAGAVPFVERHGSRYLVRLGSHLAALSADDLKHDAVRPSRPGTGHSRLHDDSWFSRTGRSMRAIARSSLEYVRSGAMDFGPDSAWGRVAAWGRGALVRALDIVWTRHKAMERRAAEGLAPLVARQQPDGAPSPAPSRRPGRGGPVFRGAPDLPEPQAAAQEPPGGAAWGGGPSPESVAKIAEMRRQLYGDPNVC